MPSSRRTFLKASSAALAALAVSKPASVWADARGPVEIWSTFRDRRHAKSDPLAWKPVSQVASDAIVINPSEERQQMLGFGAALTDASCYVFSRLSESESQALMQELFAPEMALNVCRTCIGSSDYSRTIYSFDEAPEPDPELKKFSIDHDREYILPVLRQARRINPELFLFSSPWSPPGWMKSNGSMFGGSMRKHNFAPYAHYFCQIPLGIQGSRCEHRRRYGTERSSTPNRTAACQPASGARNTRSNLSRGTSVHSFAEGPTRKSGLLDHNYNLWGRAIDEFSDPGVYDYIDGIAWHGYAGEPSAMTRVHDAFPQKNAYWTEGGPDFNSPEYQTEWANVGANLQRHLQQLGALHHRMEHGPRRKRQAKHRPVFLRRTS